MTKILGEDFFERRPQIVARELLGKFLIRRVGGKTYACVITETEAYDGSRDLACHARSGKTARNAPMWGKPAHAYVYFTYGMHWMLNLVTGKKGYPSAVLIRSAGEFIGPARLTKGLKIDGTLNGKALNKANGLWVEDRGDEVRPHRIERTPRIGVAYAGEWAKKPWRYVLKTKTAGTDATNPRL
ncbi:DNA-3-methyladenine glycosylase [Candidatus Kaiserbacteria bacterium]|nr:DNA-3-methyladenine glycosylase [Candidatus Kaiserbacteria bacterium]